MHNVTYVGMMHSELEGTYTVYAGDNWTQAISQTRKYCSSSRITWIETWINGMKYSSVDIDRNTDPNQAQPQAEENYIMFDNTIYETPDFFGYSVFNNKIAMLAEIEYWQGENPDHPQTDEDPRWILSDCQSWRLTERNQDYNLAIYQQEQLHPDYIVVGLPVNGQYDVIDAYDLFEARFSTYEEAKDFIMCSGVKHERS